MDIYQISTSTFMLVLSTIGIIFSLIFITIVIFNRQCRTLIIFITLNTAVAGVVVNIVYASQAIYQIISDVPDLLCPLRGIMLHSSTGLIYQTLCIQTIYRLFVTVYAQKRYLQSPRIVICFVIIQWLISITFGIPILLMGRIIYQNSGRICQVSIYDVFGFMYLALFIYFIPVLMISCIYLIILKYMKRAVILAGVRHEVIERRRQQRELRFMRRIIVILFFVLITGFPYVTFFFAINLGHIPLPWYAHRLSFMVLSFGQGLVAVFTLLYTDEVKRIFFNTLRKLFNCRVINSRIEPLTNHVTPMHVYTTPVT